MADEGAVAVTEAPVIESAQTFTEDTTPVDGQPQDGTTTETEEKQDGRRQPDALRKQIADLRKQAETIADPQEKARILANAKALNDIVGKGRAYEQHFPTVREAREVKALVESFGGREGLAQVQSTLAEVEQIDRMLASGDLAVNKRLWDEAPEGMTKLAPAIFAELEQRNPKEYEKAVAPHAVKFLDSSGFPEAFDRMVQAYQSGDKANGDAMAAHLAKFVASQRGGANQLEQRVDPNVERLQKELDERKSAESKQAVDQAYRDVVAHAGPAIDKHLKPLVAKLGLSAEQYNALRADTWKHLQEARNADPTYKTVAAAKYAKGMNEATAYIKSETEARALDVARARAHFWYGHQLKNGAAKAAPNVTATPVAPGITRGKEPSPSEIDYGPKGVQAAKKAGFKDLSDMILAGKAPLKAGGIRQWR